MNSIRRMVIVLSIVITSSCIIGKTSVNDELAKLKDRVDRLEKALNKTEPILRKHSCPSTCECGVDCACKNCKCGVKQKRKK